MDVSDPDEPLPRILLLKSNILLVGENYGFRYRRGQSVIKKSNEG